MNEEQRVSIFTLNLYLYTTYAPAATAAKIIVITQTATQVAFASLALLPANFPFRWLSNDIICWESWDTTKTTLLLLKRKENKLL